MNKIKENLSRITELLREIAEELDAVRVTVEYEAGYED